MTDIDYTFIHDKACEIFHNYLKHIIPSSHCEQVFYEVKRVLSEVARNEVEKETKP
jgi:hypothetical protein